MNPITLFALQALQAVPSIIAAFSTADAALTAIREHAATTADALQRMQAEKRDPTAEEWAAQAQTIATLRGQLHAAS